MKTAKKIEVTSPSHISPKTILLLGDLCALALHITFLLYFRYVGVREMMIFNCFSVALYLTLPVLLSNVKSYIPLVCAAFVEIIIHSAVATVFVGWNYGFALFLMCIVPMPFFLDFKRNFIPYIISSLMVIGFLFLKIYTADESHIVYSLNNPKSETALYISNSFTALVMILIMSAISKITRNLTQQKLKAKNETLSKLATIDPLTELFNRRAMTDFLKQIHEHSQATGENYIIVMGDIDNFKTVNDTFGHSNGDLVLKELSKILINTIPAEGYICRWGGEELLFVIPNADLTKGTKIAEKIRTQISQMKFTEQGIEFNVTITMGICECNSKMSYEKAISIADQYMYYGKQCGKNCVISKYNYSNQGKSESIRTE